MAIPKCRQWRLFVAESRRKYWLDNVPIASIVKRAELINLISPSVTDFCTFNEDTNKWLTVGEFRTYCSRIIEVNDWSPGGRGKAFIQKIYYCLKDFPDDSKCCLYQLSPNEQSRHDERRERLARMWWNRPKPCDFCGRKGKSITSPWGLPATLTVCQWHNFLLFFDSTLYSVLAIVIACLLMAISLNPAFLLLAFIILLALRFVPFWNIL